MELWVAYERLYPGSYWTPMNLSITDTASLPALLQACAISLFRVNEPGS